MDYTMLRVLAYHPGFYPILPCLVNFFFSGVWIDIVEFEVEVVQDPGARYVV